MIHVICSHSWTNSTCVLIRTDISVNLWVTSECSSVTVIWHHLSKTMEFYLCYAKSNSTRFAKFPCQWQGYVLDITILCLIPRTTVTLLNAHKDTCCKTHPLCVNHGVPFWTCEKTHNCANKRLPLEYVLKSRSFSRWDKVESIYSVLLEIVLTIGLVYDKMSLMNGLLLSMFFLLLNSSIHGWFWFTWWWYVQW